MTFKNCLKNIENVALLYNLIFIFSCMRSFYSEYLSQIAIIKGGGIGLASGVWRPGSLFLASRRPVKNYYRLFLASRRLMLLIFEKAENI